MQGIKRVVVTVVWACLAGELEACAPHRVQDPRLGAREQTVKPAEDGTILLEMPIQIAERRLKPGRYELQERVDRGAPRLQIIEVRRYAQFKRLPTITKTAVADVACRLQFVGEPAAETAIRIRAEDGVASVEWVTLAGADGRCVPVPDHTEARTPEERGGV